MREGNDVFKLLYTGDLLQARDACYKLLSDVTGGEDVHLVSQPEAQVHGLDLVRPLSTWPQYDQWFSTITPDFALVGADHDTAMVITRHEDLREDLVMTGRYECTGPTKHFFPRPSVTVNHPCPKAGCPGLITVSAAIEEGQWNEKRDVSSSANAALVKANLLKGRDRVAAEKKAALARGEIWSE